MNAPSYTPPKHWFLRALALLALVAASCTVPNFEISNDAGAGASHCTNLVSDEGETGVDCGGTCPGCAPGGTCVVNNDCLNNQCIAGICQDASCTDSALSGSETDVDCGGGACTGCSAGLRCVINRDCASGVCLTGACAQASCSDKVLNQDETDVDCGGSSCPACVPGQHCKLPTDCAGGDCTGGLCTLTCLDGKGNCDGDASNGCETNLKTDADHCGACETPCSLPHATAACTGGSCTIATCIAPFADCDGDPTNGCEVNTSSDPLNCNACGTACSAINGMPSCVASACQVTCNDGFQDCDNEPANGCETNTNIDVTNCSKCGKVCDTTMGSATCKVGVCGVSTCKAGLGDCDADPTTCETNTTNDVNNCGGCGKACVVPNGTPSCVNSVCKVATCNAGFADCDGKITNGCETNIAGDSANCGTCGTICSLSNATAKCVNKACQVATCSATFADCDGSAANGCETNTSTNSANCGGCGANGVNCAGQFANATGKCVTSACQLSACSANFADCNTVPNDGCEVDLRSNNSNCGTCGLACQAPHGANTCTLAACKPACDAGADGNCDGNNNNGCEVVFANDSSNCGGCGTVCQQTNATNTCSGGSCSPVCTQSFFKSCDGNNNNGCET
ncbi:MAG TPA: hypothetical protein VGM44_22575, partial [Polyangiaceae bacterium]